jgi:branched-chain amino acid transport system substrate-binding protein
MTYRPFRSFLASVALLALAAPIGQPAAAQPKPYTIDVILSLTGLAANLGQDQSAGLGAFEKWVNRNGGIRGMPVHFEISDDQSQPAVAVQLLSRIIASRPAVVLGSSLAGPTQAMAPLVKDGPLLYAMTPNLVPPKGGYLFSTSALTRDLDGAAVEYYRLRGLTRIATLVTNDASGQNNLEGIEAAVQLPENKGMQIVDRESFGLGDVSMDAQAAKIKASGAQVVFALPNGTAFGTAIHGLSDVGLDLPVFTSAANFSPTLLERFKSFLPKELTCAGASFFNRDRPPSDPLKKPIDDFYAALAVDGITAPTASHAFAWDPALIIVSALRALGPQATAADLRDYVEKLRRFPGAQGIYDFSSGDQHGLAQSGILVLRNDPDHPGRTTVASKQGGAPL